MLLVPVKVGQPILIIFSINYFLDKFLGKCLVYGDFNVVLDAEEKERAVRNSLLQSMLR